MNIAARLQTQPVPGGICLSNTFYDVVNNRLPFYVNDLGARKLKNIGKVTAYQISPMESQPAGFRIVWYRYRAWLQRSAWVGVILFLIVLAYLVGVNQIRKQKEKRLTKTNPPARAELASAMTKSEVQPAMAPPVIPPPAPATNAPPPMAPLLIEASQTEFDAAQYNFMRSYDFDGMLQWMAKTQLAGEKHLSSG